jgi:multidrug transporter EmrE-like cation transporter
MTSESMQTSTFFLILSSVAMGTTAQLLLKIGMSHGGIKEAMAGQAWGGLATQVATNHWVIGGLSLYALSAVVWLLVLARVQLSYAYPFVGIGFIITMLMGWWVLGDAMSVQRVGGTLLIATGIALVARGG